MWGEGETVHLWAPTGRGGAWELSGRGPQAGDLAFLRRFWYPVPTLPVSLCGHEIQAGKSFFLRLRRRLTPGSLVSWLSVFLMGRPMPGFQIYILI